MRLPLTIRLVTPSGLSHDPGEHAHRFRLFRFRSPLLTESLLFSFPPGTEMVHFPGFALADLWIQSGVTGLSQPGSPIRRSTGQRLLAPHRRLSQLATSFIAFTRQGIHRVPLVA